MRSQCLVWNGPFPKESRVQTLLLIQICFLVSTWPSVPTWTHHGCPLELLSFPRDCGYSRICFIFFPFLSLHPLIHSPSFFLVDGISGMEWWLSSSVILVTLLLLWRTAMNKVTYRRKHFVGVCLPFKGWAHEHHGGEYGGRYGVGAVAERACILSTSSRQREIER